MVKGTTPFRNHGPSFLMCSGRTVGTTPQHNYELCISLGSFAAAFLLAAAGEPLISFCGPFGLRALIKRDLFLIVSYQRFSLSSLAYALYLATIGLRSLGPF